MNISEKAINILKEKYGINKVDIAIVTGSGLAKSVPELDNKVVVPYEDIGLPKSRVEGHKDCFVFGKYGNKNIVIVSRLHYYENADIKIVMLPLQVVSGLGAESVVLLTSCGGLNKEYRVGDIMVINDHINMSGINPLLKLDKITFTNMLNCYEPEYISQINQIASQNGIKLKNGVHCQMSGPSYETRAEVEMLRLIGCDSVSMSTAHDCIIAKYLNMKVAGFAIIVNIFEETTEDMSHKEVLDNANKASEKVQLILNEFLKLI